MSVMNIKLNNIGRNLEKITEKLNKNTTLLAMVKANAYGLGDYEIAEYLESKGVNFFGVAYVKEGVHLRKNGINSNILVTSRI
ncbi:MAG: alanine racemase [Clostridia bacterium]|nr:alanine racemase [Clostridia bacterium]